MASAAVTESIDGDLPDLDFEDVDGGPLLASGRIVQEPTSEILSEVSTGEILTEASDEELSQGKQSFNTLPEDSTEEVFTEDIEEIPPVGYGVNDQTGLMRPLFGDMTIASFEQKEWSTSFVSFLTNLRVFHAVAVFSGLAVLVLGVVLIIATSDDEKSGESLDDSAVATVDGKKPAVDTAKTPKKTDAKPEAKKDGKKTDEKPASISADVAPGGCKPFKLYPAFPWRKHLEAVLAAGGHDGLCALFGTSPSIVVGALKDLPHTVPTGYDPIPGGKVFEVFPGGKAVRRAPTMEFLFVRDRLFEIRLKYGASGAPGLSADLFNELLGDRREAPADLQKRKLSFYIDDDLLIEKYRKTDKYRRVFNEIVLSSKTVRDSMAAAVDVRNQAEAAFAKGMGQFSRRKWDKAIESYQNARNLVPGLGNAYVFEAIIQIRQEHFDDASALAERAVELSRDGRVQAEAKGVLAVSALYHRHKDKAITLFREAAALDPANGEFGTSAEELLSGKYASSRVAKTAARMSCKDKSKKKRRSRKKKKEKAWTTDGLMARGNFPDKDTYYDALRKVKKKRGFRRDFDQWVGWECN
jgi:tetratricopeptide (TPR) repeat protein